MRLMVIPKPQSVIINEEASKFELNETITITLPKNGTEFFFCSKMLADSLSTKLCREILILSQEEEKAHCVKADVSLYFDEKLSKEGYRLEIEASKGIEIFASSKKGMLYGIQTLRQLVEQFGTSFPKMLIEDAPRFSLRGFYHDITRGRVPKLEYLKRLADKLLYYKYNQLQLYVEHTYLFSFFPELCEDEDYLTAEEIRELDEYCREREIELVPSLASFGHLYHLLRTPKYAHLCELPEQENIPFSFWGRMSHHTIDVSNDESLELILKMTDEYMSNFSSKYYNLCGDETFDLGKGRSKELADKIGTRRLYLDFVKKISSHLCEKGKVPMFWGDVIGAFPESIKELPEETICLNWGYDANVTEEPTRKLAAAGAKQVLCPGANGWNRLVNNYGIAYENITKMCSYADKYGALGVLTTDWGDYGHINSPLFSFPCMLYGAEYSWNTALTSKDEIDERISFTEYHDKNCRIMQALRQIDEQTCLSWFHTVLLVQGHIDGIDVNAEVKSITDSKVEAAHRKLDDTAQTIKEFIKGLEADITQNSETIEVMTDYCTAIEGIGLLNAVGLALAEASRSTESANTAEAANAANTANTTNTANTANTVNATTALAAEELIKALREWFAEYSERWNRISKKSELYRIEEVIDGLCGLMKAAANNG